MAEPDQRSWWPYAAAALVAAIVVIWVLASANGWLDTFFSLDQPIDAPQG